MQANLLASITKHYGLTDSDKSILLSTAELSDQCNTDILDSLGNTYITLRNNVMAAFVYGTAMKCSPANALMRFKFGESLLMMNYIQGKEDIDDALRLEPNNPLYLSEERRLTAIQSRLR